ncbi:NAD-dependent epimerase/dehydratase [Haloferax elongans ATCC BAA-1513]|uniref:NAD-dependent epimerase/dehydratase n=1 Tax=Haloferax elongans ATCC BAA-1513 TaxID=1230453 RepID=M0HNB3_HALEO|nr:NAD-dependent epimerase/dehydratase family protein [Haloferax elongans]ELZ86055.1 NAD-dependent epimerase/dehydratase [Haloferax elongans ATCC BAA-1513]
MTSALVIGGTGFVGHYTTAELLDHGYKVTVFSRGVRDYPSDPREGVSYVTVARADADALESAAERVDPDIVIDNALFHPEHARVAVEIFADVDAYVYVSSGGVYDAHEIPKREDETALHSFSAEQAGDNTMRTYGPRKAECDRIVRAAADRGVAATCVRPTMVYGPKSTASGDTSLVDAISWAADLPELQDHHDYWIDRIDRYDRVVVPGDGTAIWHRVYVEDVARALRVVAESGTPGEVYNAADRTVFTMEDVIDLIAETLDTTVDVYHASRRELAEFDLEPDDFVLYHHLGSDYPHVLSTCKLSSLGWDSTPPEVAMERTVEESLASERDGSMFDPGREAEERFIEAVTG